MRRHLPGPAAVAARSGGRAGGLAVAMLALAGSIGTAEAGCEDQATIRLLTRAENPSLDPDTAVILINGPIALPAVEELERIAGRLQPYDRVIVDLDSPGGALAYGERVAAVLEDLRRTVTVDTLVRQGSECLSVCILVFLQGEKRVAGGSSAWLFHGVCRAFASLPLPGETERFITMLEEGGAAPDFVATLRQYLFQPGEFWLSGYELFSVREAGIITDLLDPWRPAIPAISRP